MGLSGAVHDGTVFFTAVFCAAMERVFNMTIWCKYGRRARRTRNKANA